MRSEVEMLEATLRAANRGYAEGDPIMDDGSYDSMMRRLREIAPASPLLKENWTDTSDDLAKAKHIIPMGSQDKANEPEEFDAWFNAQPKGTILTCQHKLDGASIELQYEQGMFIRAVTRGDGTTGDVVTNNVSKMEGVPMTVDRQFSGAVRGEVVMRRSVFNKYFKDSKANCRNAAVGILKRQDGKDAHRLTVICYDTTVDACTEWDKLEWLRTQGFLDVRMGYSAYLCETADAVHRYRQLTADMRASLDYDIDGIVIKHNHVDRDDERLPRPTHQIAYKFELDQAATKLKNVIWQQSGKTFTPVALFDPVKLAGASVERANLVNLAGIHAMGIKIGSTINVVRRGEVIPKVIECLYTPPDGCEILPPDVCPTCGTRLAVDEVDELHVECTNTECPARIEHQILCWLDTLKIKGIGPATVHAAVRTGTWKGIASLYEWDPGDMCALSERNIFQAIHSKEEVSLAQLIAGFDIEGIGVSTMNDIVGAGYRSLDRLMTASVDELMKIPGVGQITAATLLAGIEANLRDMLALTSSGHVKILAEITEGVLVGKTVCFTGPLNTMSRDEAELRVKAAGGQAKSSVVKGLTYLVTNDPHSGSAKNKKAEAQGTTVIDEEQFLAILSGKE